MRVDLVLRHPLSLPSGVLQAHDTPKGLQASCPRLPLGQSLLALLQLKHRVYNMEGHPTRVVPANHTPFNIVTLDGEVKIKDVYPLEDVLKALGAQMLHLCINWDKFPLSSNI